LNSGSWILIFTLIVIFVLFSLLRKRGGPTKYPEYVQSVIWDIRLNQAIVSSFFKRAELKLKPRRFESTNWMLNKNRVTFLNESLKNDLNEIFDMVAQYNQDLKVSWKTNPESYGNIDLSHFKELLDRSREALEEWMVENYGQKEYSPKPTGISGLFFGER